MMKCGLCGKEFKSEDRRTRYCSPECRLEAVRVQNLRNVHKFRGIGAIESEVKPTPEMPITPMSEPDDGFVKFRLDQKTAGERVGELLKIAELNMDFIDGENEKWLRKAQHSHWKKEDYKKYCEFEDQAGRIIDKLVALFPFAYEITITDEMISELSKATEESINAHMEAKATNNKMEPDIRAVCLKLLPLLDKMKKQRDAAKA